MSPEPKPHLPLEIAHVLFMDVVGYSKLLIDEQKELLQTLNEIVLDTEQCRVCDAAGKLIRLPSGDGMALVFFDNLEAPAECALEISAALKNHPEISLRMGIHSGPVSQIADVNHRSTVAGAGINYAQRVMDCGDAGHILVSKHVAEDLEEYRRWRPHLHDLGEAEVKHGVRLSLFNLYTEEIGNPKLPQKLQAIRKNKRGLPAGSNGRSWPRRHLIFGVAILLAVAAATVAVLAKRSGGKIGAPSSAATANVPNKSVAVLPFENLSDDKRNAYFTDGVQDEILTHLAKIAELKVISRTSVMQYKSGIARNLREIGQQLGVAHLLEGSVQRAENRVRVHTQLIDARTDAQLWANTYDRELADVFAIQSEIAKAIAGQLKAKISFNEQTAIDRPPTDDLAAFDLYTRGKTLLLSTVFSFRIKENLTQAVDLFTQAIAHDPDFFLAYCQLAAAHDQLYFLGQDHTPARIALGDAAVQAALRLRPEAAEAHLALAQHLYRGYLDYNRARAEIAIAQRALPNDPLLFELTGYIDRRQGRWEESTQHLERAIELDPRNFYTLQQISASYYFLRRYAEMAAVLERALAIVPDDVNTRIVRAFVDLDWHADPQPLHSAIEELLAKDPASSVSFADSWLTLALCQRDPAAAERALAALAGNNFGSDAILLSPAFGEGLVSRLRGDETAAQSAFATARAQQEKLTQAQPDYGPAICVLGLIDAELGRKKEAMREGRRAVELLPVTRDSVNGAHMIEFFAIICGLVGEKELAFQQLKIAVETPGTLSYGQLKLHPFWDSLRSDARFSANVAALAPKEVAP